MPPFFERLAKSRWLTDDFVKSVFDNVRNFTIAALVMWAGLYMAENPYKENAIFISAMWRILILGAFGLWMLNMHHGFKKISEFIDDPFVRWLNCCIYFLFSVGLFYVLYRHRFPVLWNPTAT